MHVGHELTRVLVSTLPQAVQIGLIDKRVFEGGWRGWGGGGND